MIFSSNIFILLFLPTVLIAFYMVGQRSDRMAIAFLAMASLVFYGWWNVAYLPLLLGSILMNFAFGRLLAKYPSRLIITAAVAANLALLGYFKYWNFFADTARDVFFLESSLTTIALPLAISFFTFQQIAYLVSVYRGDAAETNFIQYVLFVSFFPQLIAGPIVHHKEMMPQFNRPGMSRFDLGCFATGLTLFAFGMFKKVCIADQIAPHVDLIFRNAENGVTLKFFEAWGAALAFNFQIYFDFSGYIDMALGIACLFGIRLPVNFYSPYKAANIIEFWHRWNMTLSRFLREYLYIPLGGNRHGQARRYANLMITMLLGGLWHGAGWTFVVWGGLHGLYLAMNHGWRWMRRNLGHDPDDHSLIGIASGRVVTLVAVVFAWVFFRADSFGGAQAVLSGMAGLNGISIPSAILSQLGPLGNVVPRLGIEVAASGGVNLAETYSWIIVLLVVVWFLPNSVEVLAPYRPALNLPEHEPGLSWIESHFGSWTWTPLRAIAASALAFFSFKLINAGAPVAFIYFIF